MTQNSKIRVAIIGGGPGGLGAAIALSSLPSIEVSLFERAAELKEIGAGIRIGPNCWRVLDLLGVTEGVEGHLKTSVLHRNGLTGEVVKEQEPSTLPLKYQPQRVRRTKLQSALRAKVSEGIIHLSKKLISVTDLKEGVRLDFQDGTSYISDLVVGADGIRSVVRQHIFSDHAISFTGTTIWRVLIPLSSISHIPSITPDTTWWHGPAGHVYTSLVDSHSTPLASQALEISARNVIDPKTATGNRFSWGIDATNARVRAHFEGFDGRVREAMDAVPEGEWKEFSAFAGERLKTLTGWGKVALIGDASHPLSGAFGSGAAFALEDGYILAKAISHARTQSTSSHKIITTALETFDKIRSPYYLRMYEYLDMQRLKVAEAGSRPKQSWEEVLKVRLDAFGQGGLDWIYGNDIEKVWDGYLVGEVSASM